MTLEMKLQDVRSEEKDNTYRKIISYMLLTGHSLAGIAQTIGLDPDYVKRLAKSMPK